MVSPAFFVTTTDDKKEGNMKVIHQMVSVSVDGEPPLEVHVPLLTNSKNVKQGTYLRIFKAPCKVMDDGAEHASKKLKFTVV